MKKLKEQSLSPIQTAQPILISPLPSDDSRLWDYLGEDIIRFPTSVAEAGCFLCVCLSKQPPSHRLVFN